MRVLFCHDGPLRKDELGNFYGTAHNDDTFNRYYSIANELVVVIRVNKISKAKAEKRLSRIEVSPFEVIECPNLSSLEGIVFKRNIAKDIIKNEVMKSDYVVARLPSIIGFNAIKFARKYNIPYLIELVTCPWDALWNHSLKGKLVAPILYYTTKKCVSDASHVLYVTNEFLQNRYPTKGKSVNCSNVALNEFNDTILENRLKKIQAMNGKLIIGTTASVNVRFKGQQYIIEALGLLKKKGITNFEYQLVGGGDQTFLRKVAQKFDVPDQVKFLGSIKHKDVFKWLDSIDIYVQPSRQEGLPRALIEAMSRGLPAFGARTAGIPELLGKNFIFSNSNKNIEEICSILLTFNRETMLIQAYRNYKESQKYDRKIIEERRKDFFVKFKNENQL